ncbi:MAG: nucleotidyltransferase domain-containing protein [Oscillospiraceae bacterium]|nr:nucleotidyltransferase domain-containing protein [Oscillospiraceae bacterium]
MINNEEILKIKDLIIAAVDVERLYLFGSYAYGTPNEDSDYDFYMVIPNGGIRPIDAMHQARGALRGLKRSKSVDLLANTSERFAYRSQGLTMERTIAEKGVVLYEC